MLVAGPLPTAPAATAQSDSSAGRVQVFKQGNRSLIRLGDTDVEYDPNFRLYLTSKLANPHYLPEVCIKVTLINFTVTNQGLEDQLLGDVVRAERPDLEESRDRLVVSISSDKRQLKVCHTSSCLCCTKQALPRVVHKGWARDVYLELYSQVEQYNVHASHV